MRWARGLLTVRRLMIAVAVAGVLMALVIQGGRALRRRSQCLANAQHAGREERLCRAMLRGFRLCWIGHDQGSLWSPLTCNVCSQAWFDSRLSLDINTYDEAVRTLERAATAYGRARRKYERCARYPWTAVQRLTSEEYRLLYVDGSPIQPFNGSSTY